MTNVEFHLQLNHNETWSMSRLHFHDYYELLLPLTSPGNIFVNDQVYPLQRGTLYLIGENTLHRTMATGFHARYILHISRKALDQLSTPQTDFTQLTHDSFRRANLNAEEMTDLIELFQALERNKNDGSFGSDIHQMTALLNLLVYVAPALNAATAGEAIRNKDFLRVAPILDYIRDNLADPLTLDQIAGNFLSASTISAASSRRPPASPSWSISSTAGCCGPGSCFRRASACSRRESAPAFPTTPTSSAPSATSPASPPAAMPRSTSPATKSCCGRTFKPVFHRVFPIL